MQHRITSYPVKFDGSLRRKKSAYKEIMKKYDGGWKGKRGNGGWGGRLKMKKDEKMKGLKKLNKTIFFILAKAT